MDATLVGGGFDWWVCFDGGTLNIGSGEYNIGYYLLFPFTSGGESYVFLLFSKFLMQKTRKSIAKRFKKTGTGKLLRRTPGHRHLLRNKSVKQRRRAGSSKLVAPGQRANLIRGLPFA